MMNEVCVRCNQRKLSGVNKNSLCAACQIFSNAIDELDSFAKTNRQENQLMRVRQPAVKRCDTCFSSTVDFLVTSDSTCVNCELKEFQKLGELPCRVSVQEVYKLAKETGREEVQKDLKYGRGSIYCSSPGCSTKLKNKYSVICSYCKSKHGYYR